MGVVETAEQSVLFAIACDVVKSEVFCHRPEIGPLGVKLYSIEAELLAHYSGLKFAGDKVFYLGQMTFFMYLFKVPAVITDRSQVPLVVDSHDVALVATFPANQSNDLVLFQA